nr:lasso peptide biosynthesis PqqD family chaperone [uncultured Cellulosilyticum sp.]
MKKENITLTTTVLQKREIYLTDLDDDKVMMDLDTGNYYALNSIGASIWEGIENPITVENLVQNLLKEYDVSQTVCEEQVLAYLQKLYNADLVAVIA